MSWPKIFSIFFFCMGNFTLRLGIQKNDSVLRVGQRENKLYTRFLCIHSHVHERIMCQILLIPTHRQRFGTIKSNVVALSGERALDLSLLSVNMSKIIMFSRGHEYNTLFMYHSLG